MIMIHEMVLNEGSFLSFVPALRWRKLKTQRDNQVFTELAEGSR